MCSSRPSPTVRDAASAGDRSLTQARRSVEKAAVLLRLLHEPDADEGDPALGLGSETRAQVTGRHRPARCAGAGKVRGVARSR